MTNNVFFRRYWWIIPALAICFSLAALASPLPDRGALAGGLIGVAAAFYYFVQQQRLQDLSLFKQLFSEFNQRYDELNDELAKIEAGAPGLNPKEQRQKIVDYLNLCSEEYLFWTEDYIHEKAWKSWCRGMLYYLDKEPFASVWKEECSKESYYGLDLDVIRKHAATNSKG